MGAIDIVRKAYEELWMFCKVVELNELIKVDDIPEEAVKSTDIEYFNHRYTLIKTSHWDDCDFHGIIFIPFNDKLYMKFTVYA